MIVIKLVSVSPFIIRPFRKNNLEKVNIRYII